MGDVVNIGNAFNAKTRELKHDPDAGHAADCPFHGLACLDCCCGLPHKGKLGSTDNIAGAKDYE